MAGNDQEPRDFKSQMPSWLRGDWWRLVAVGAVALVLSLIGFNIASRVEPSGVPSTSPMAADETTTTTSPVTTIGEPTTTAAANGTTHTSSAGEPATLSLSTTQVDLGDSNSATVDVVHEGGGVALWSISSQHLGLSVDPAEGELGAGETETVGLSLDRSQIEEGEFETSLTLSWEGGETDVVVTAVHEDNPIIHNPKASPATVLVAGGSSCSPTSTTVSARVRDTSDLAEVVARWSPDGSTIRETALSPVGEDIYEGVIGPYTIARTDEVRVIAFDVRDNAGGATILVTVASCP